MGKKAVATASPTPAPTCVFSCDGKPLDADKDGVLRIQLRTIQSDYRFDDRAASKEECGETAVNVCTASHVQKALLAIGSSNPVPTYFYGEVHLLPPSSAEPTCFFNCGGESCKFDSNVTDYCEAPAGCVTQIETLAITADDCTRHAKAYCDKMATHTPAPSANSCFRPSKPFTSRKNQTYLWTFVAVILAAWVLVVVFYLTEWFGRTRRHKR
jgi:hypothetical protein